MFEIGISSFRVFESQQSVKVTPLTIVTGGNSAGKTSFLAAVRMLSDLGGWSSASSSFNRDPFFLGSFDQIAHHRGGRFGRSKSFTLSVKGNPSRYRSNHFIPRRADIPTEASLALTYRNYMGQPALSCFHAKFPSMTAELKYSDSWKTATFEIISKEMSGTTTMSASSLPPPDMMSSQGIFISSTIDQMLFKLMDDLENDSSRILSTTISFNIRAALGMLPSMGFAGGPVRTKPLRTYDPTDVTSQSEGAHVPSRMAQLSRTHPEEWDRTKAEINRFGSNSGLFKEIEVRRLGKGDSDPFQINVSINGPRRNIVDVGYGVSQAIPIIFELATRTPEEIYMLQQPEVHLHPQAQAALGSYIVSNLHEEDGTIIVETHSDYLIDRVRRHIRDGDIAKEDVSLLYFERGDFTSTIHNIKISDAGEITSPPESYREFFLNEQIENLSL